MENNISSYNFISELWDDYKNSDNIHDVLTQVIKVISTQLNAEFGLIYLEDTSVLTSIDLSDEKDPTPNLTSKFLLDFEFYRTKKLFPEKCLSKSKLKLNKLTRISNSVSFQSISSSSIGIKNEAGNFYNIFAFESSKIILCRALFIFSFGEKAEMSIHTKQLIAHFLDISVPIIESIYRRQIDRLSRKIISSSEGLYALNPGDYFQKSFTEICKQLDIEGASIIVRGLPSSETPLQIVATYPKKMPSERRVYTPDNISPTQWIFKHGISCLVPNMHEFRKQFDIAFKKINSKAVWGDSKISDKNRSVLYNFSNDDDDIQYLFRWTNSNQGKSNVFNVFDQKIGKELITNFALMHKSLENEQRAMKIFLDVKHEFRQKLTGINSASNYIKKSITKQTNNNISNHERLLKLDHIKNTISEIVKMLDRFNFPLATTEDGNADQITAIKPYADLIRPICETFLQKAQKDGKRFTYHKFDQLGLIYSDLSQWRQVIENIVNNMVKYTHHNEEMAIAFERVSKKDGFGGGKIHFASKSAPIKPDEIKMLFEFKYRSKAAINMTNEGDGLGLSIVKYIVSKHGGQILVRTEGKINIFTLVLPKHLFRPPENNLSTGEQP